MRTVPSSMLVREELDQLLHGELDEGTNIVPRRPVTRLVVQSSRGRAVGPEFGDPLASAQVDGDARKSVSTTRSVFFLLR